jgi:hypothetical protein
MDAAKDIYKAMLPIWVGLSRPVIGLLYTIEEDKKELLHKNFQIAQRKFLWNNIKIDIKKYFFFVNYQFQPS